MVTNTGREFLHVTDEVYHRNVSNYAIERGHSNSFVAHNVADSKRTQSHAYLDTALTTYGNVGDKGKVSRFPSALALLVWKLNILPGII